VTTPDDLTRSMAGVAASLVAADPVTDIVAILLGDCCAALQIDAAGLMVRDAAGELQLLGSTSHRVDKLEIFQLQAHDGPCLESVRDDRVVELRGREAIEARWPRTGPAITAAGFIFTHAVPVRWHGHVIGGLNLFHSQAAGGNGWAELAQSFADIAALVIVSSAPIGVEAIFERAQAAVQARTVIERAKGIIAYERNIDVGEAYDELVRRAEQQSTSLTAMAIAIADEVVSRARS
jgi:ANTAR domain